MLKFGLKSLITEVQLNMMRHYVNAGSSFDNYSFAREKDILEAGTEVYILKKFKIHKVTFGVEHIRLAITGGCISTLLK